jgi:agmatinase
MIRMNPSWPVVCFPFDLFGNSGCGAGAQLLFDVVREIVEDQEMESSPIRSQAYTEKLQLLEVEFEDLKSLAAWQSLGVELAQKHFQRALKSKSGHRPFMLWLGGNHLSIAPIYQTLGKKDLIIQFDAHLDIFDLHDTKQSLTHGNFIRHGSYSVPIINIGHRDLLIPQNDIQQFFEKAIAVEDMTPDQLHALSARCQQAERIWIDIDLDVIDPTFCPAVHQRTPFGIPPLTLLNWLTPFINNRKVVGVSLSEFDPSRDIQEMSLQLIGWLLEWLLVKTSAA